MKTIGKILKKIDYFIFKYFGFILYPPSKCGKEKRNEDLQIKYKNQD